MLVGIISDTHDNVPKVKRAIDLLNQRKVAAVVHCGDFEAPFVMREIVRSTAPVRAVFGNNDGEKAGLRKLLPDLQEPPYEFELGGSRFVVAHAFDDTLLARDVDYVLYGHTHEVLVKPGKPMLINPGECGGWLTGKPTIAILELETALVEVVELS